MDIHFVYNQTEKYWPNITNNIIFVLIAFWFFFNSVVTDSMSSAFEDGALWERNKLALTAKRRLISRECLTIRILV